MTLGSYGQFCPVAMAAEMLCTRWTIVLVREMVAGSTRFNDLRRGVPRMSPSLLSQRLKELEVAGIVSRGPADDEPSVQEYRLTKAGHDLQSIIEAFGIWGQKWIETQATLENLDPSLLMWDMRRNLDPSPLPDRRTVISFLYPELAGGRRHWWLVVEPFGAVDLCSTDPGYDVDLWVTTNLRTMTEIWMGLARVEQVRDKIQFEGDPAMASTMQTWLGLSPFSSQSKLVH
ncbi:DNA-binding HxlR family transcriptional regulator [Devosia subaequoris]|uniref:DNA-binding HxlR family transcriptional regulator n=1 Tax=Devosia subaequoris TaxID=395930 RepID=A0A7W6ILV1_9HYPH|nr:helix-turn-helix domain-containing protein [Devosia subaequoris]MBB4051964.1 DNA-binding HxlR family transcriptional regulator [Devosia subaequoris]MCP1210129.1 helix-turn-helix transcriptional regulator [Devosia subaequoris]